MNAVATHRIHQEERMGKALLLALVVHLALVAFLWIGVRWQNELPATAEAEVWDMQAREAAPKPVPQPEPIVPQPTVKAPVVPDPLPVRREIVAKPDIALEREKKRKEAEKIRRDEQAKKAEEKQARKVEEKKRVLAEQKRAEAVREENLRRLHEAAGSGGGGTATKSTGSRADASYAQKVSARIKANTAFSVPPGLNGNPAVEYSVELLPDGSLRSAPRKLKSSGVPGFDEAVLRAIEKSEPYPADRSGKVPSIIKITHKPKE